MMVSQLIVIPYFLSCVNSIRPSLPITVDNQSLRLQFGVNDKTTNVESTIAYRNSYYGYSLNMPTDWVRTEDNNITTFKSPTSNMEIIIQISGEERINKIHSDAIAKFPDIKLDPWELFVYLLDKQDEDRGAKVTVYDWSKHARTTFSYWEGHGYKSWVKKIYILDKGRLFFIVFKAFGYTDSEFENNRQQVNGICKTISIDGVEVIKLPEGKTIFDF